MAKVAGTKPPPYFGGENAIYKYVDTATGRWHSVPSNGKYPNTTIDIPRRYKVVDSILMAWIRQGNSLSGQRDEIIANIGDNPFLVAAAFYGDIQGNSLEKKSVQQTVGYLSKLECFFMAVLPAAAFTLALEAIKAQLGVPNATDIDIPAITAVEFDAFVTYLREKPATEFGEGSGVMVSSPYSLLYADIALVQFCGFSTRGTTCLMTSNDLLVFCVRIVFFWGLTC